jgi:hypothetical protein
MQSRVQKSGCGTRRDLWRIARISAIEPVRHCGAYILIDLNSLPLVWSRAGLKWALR